MEGKRSQKEAGIPPSPFHESLSVHPTQNTRAAKTAVVARPNGAVLWDRWASGLKSRGRRRETGVEKTQLWAPAVRTGELLRQSHP